MWKVYINNEYDEKFYKSEDGLNKVREHVVKEIQKEEDVLEVLKSTCTSEAEMERAASMLSGPELFTVDIVGLKIHVALLENLCNWDVFNPQWEVMFKVDKYCPKLGNVGILYNTMKDGKDNFSYELLLTRLSEVIKSKIEI